MPASRSPCFDGQYFYDTDHVWGDSGTQSNDLTYDASDHTAVTVAEFRAAFTQAVIAMMGFKRDNGTFYYRPTIGRIDNLMISVPLALWEVAIKAFEQTIALEGGAGTSNVMIARPKIVCNQYMGSGWTGGSDVKFDLYNLGQPLKPFVFQASEPLRVQTKGAEDIEFNALQGHDRGPLQRRLPGVVVCRADDVQLVPRRHGVRGSGGPPHRCRIFLFVRWF